ncbi:histidine kinase [Prevotella sp. LMAG:51]|uniref:sensor histidine kinase n=1 Tax=Prevotella sp. LMAG:51 TaxID=1969564 RepID=UPI003390759B
MKNLRNQVNPHFLLNTLNNIYALTAFNQQKAQEAILELSGMLRHILYDNQQDFVRLDDEIKFIHSYINLMKIRIPKTTKIQIQVNVPKDTELRIAPLIFISLIENAFKHGIGTAENSFIHINIYADRNHIACEIENSNFPKNDTDRSGHGIGLEQVGKRLELAYHKKYTWEKGTKDNNKIYYSNIYIYDTKLRDN